MRSGKQAGFSVLEQAIALPVLLTVLMAAMDINSVFQGYSALQSGVRQSLRCTFTTDGKCVSTSPDTRPRLFNYYLVQRDPLFLVDRFDLSGNIAWIDLPSYRFDNFRAKVLDQVHFDAPTATFSASRTYYPATVDANFDMRIARLPYILGDPKDPQTRFRGNHALHYGAVQSINIENIQGTITPGQPAYVIGWADLPIITRSANLFASSSIDAGNENYNHEPDFSKAESTASASIAVHITGFRRGTDEYSHGSVGIRLYKVVAGQNQFVKTLGGRSFGKDGPLDVNPDANFVIRGLTSEYIDPVVPQYQELDLYSPLNIEYGQQYKIRFKLYYTDGTRVAWQGDRLKVYFPKDELNQTRNYSCQGGLAACDGTNACSVAEVPASASAVLTNVHHLTNLPPVRYDSAIALSGCVTAPSSYQTLLSANNINQCEANFTFSFSTGSCPLQPQVIHCASAGQTGNAASGPNYGVPETPLSDGFIHSSSTASSICPASTSTAITIGSPENVRWTESEQGVPNDDIAIGSSGVLTWAKNNCSAQWQFPSGSGLPNYPKLSYNTTLSGYVPHYTGTLDPAALKSDPASGFACPELPLNSRKIDILPTQVNSGNQNSLFFGERTLPGCDWQEQLRSDGIQHSLFDAAAYFWADNPALGLSKDTFYSRPASCVDPNPEQIWSAPTTKTIIPGGPYSDQHPPAQCQDPTVSCAAEFAGFGPGTPSSNSYNFSLAAQHFGFNEVQAQYPRAKWNCSGADCVNISVTDNGDSLRADSSIEVPIRLFMGRTVKLNFSEQERKEREFIK
ncbi:MAG: hypothetical protein K1X79_09815 [Oligoflexia bacterium]|nr:hypothetical protein [Oligoflexia bacterium]